MESFTIPGRLPGLNDLIGSMNSNRWMGATLKKKATCLCAQYAFLIAPIKEPVSISIRWIEANRRRDLDNISAGIKFVLDGLVESGRLPGDSRKWVKSIRHEFPEPDKNAPRIEITLEKIKTDESS